MDIRKTVESVVREVVAKMKEEKEKENQPKVLFIFCDSKAHEPFHDEFIKLNNNGIAYDLLFLDGETSSWLGSHQIESNDANKVIASDENAPAPIELPKQYDGVVIPEIDIDDAARITSGLKGTIKAEVVFAALAIKNFIIIGEDIPGIKRSDRYCLNQVELPPFHQRKFQKYMEDINELGIEIKPFHKIVDHVITKFNVTDTDNINSSVKADTPNASFEGKLLTAGWVQSHAESLEYQILLQKGTIISPLAKDLLKEKGISAQYIRS